MFEDDGHMSESDVCNKSIHQKRLYFRWHYLHSIVQKGSIYLCQKQIKLLSLVFILEPLSLASDIPFQI